MYVLGLDIGYSNLKIVAGDESARTEHVLPVGAGPAELMPRDTRGAAVDAIYVDVDGELYVAGVEPDRLQSWTRKLNDGYTESKDYKALFYAALAISGVSTIDRLVTGLPVSHFREKKYVDSLVSMMQGEHHISPKVSVCVKEVIVVPQPGGAYHHAIANIADLDTLEFINFGRSVVIDPGFFSVDYVALKNAEIQYQSSGTSLEAMSYLIQAAGDAIHRDYATFPSSQNIEKAIREERSFIIHNGKKIDLKGYLDAASSEVAPVAITAVKNDIRKDGQSPDVVILAGGGASFYKDAARAVFPDAKVVVPSNPVIANADGFWNFGHL